MRLTPVGPDAVLVRLDDEGPDAPADLAAWARGRVPAREIVPAATSVLFDGVGGDSLEEALAQWAPGRQPDGTREVEIPVVYDGPDLTATADRLGLDPGELVRRHLGTAWTSRFCGFAPGFAYLAGWDLRVPRLSSPRTRVPPGSVALADGWCGVYPGASPGGWQLIGHTDVTLWDVEADSPALLAPGTQVRFVERP